MKRLFLISAFCFLAGSTAQAQTGFPPYGSFENGRFDVVNRQNLNFHFAIPVVSVPGRGTSFSHAFQYDSLTWTPVDTGSQIVWTPSGGWKMDGVSGSITFNSETYTCTWYEWIPDYGTIEHQEYVTRFNGFQYVESSGTVHSFAVDYYDSSGDGWTCPFQTPAPTGPTTGYALDGSGLFLNAGWWNPVIYEPGGTQISQDGTITDTNGNFISRIVVSSNVTKWKDTVGREVLVIDKTSSPHLYKVLDNTGTIAAPGANYQNFSVAYATLSIQTAFNCSGIVEYIGTMSLPTQITLPDLKTYVFEYEPTPNGPPNTYTGRLKKVTLPTGGSYEYIYPSGPSDNNGIECSDGSVKRMTRKITEGTSTATWEFTRSLVSPNWKTVIAAPALYGQPANESVFTFEWTRQISQKVYQGSESSGTLLRTVNTTWNVNTTPFRTTVILENNLQSKTETTYDSYGNVTQLDEYGFASGAPGTWVRTTYISYLSTSAYTSRNILNRPTYIQVNDPFVRLVTQVAYDESAYSNTSCPASVAQHNDNAFSCTFYTRGNPTSVTTYTNPSVPSGAITRHTFYDWFGNVRKADVNCCQQKEWAYSATTKYAFPDSVTDGPPTGQQLATSAAYNLPTGLITSATDENNKTTYFTYDVFNRLTDVQRPDSQHITYAYTHTGTERSIQVESPVDGTNRLRQIAYFDTLGRPIEQRTSDNTGGNCSAAKTEYDPLGRPYKQYNPSGCPASSSYFSESRFDALGRPTVVFPPGVTDPTKSTQYAYGGATVTVTGPAGKQRKSETDALGRLIKVTEPDPANNNSLTVDTLYSYTGLDLLKTVTQGVQTRTYSYDGLGRLTSQTTPEGGAWSYAYNAFSLVTSRTDARGVITSYTYDTLNRLASVSYNVGSTGVPATATVSYSYGTDPALNEKGRLKTVTDGAGSETLTYDAFGRVSQVQKVISGTTYTTSYAYNLASELTSITYPSNRVVTQGYDAIGRLNTVASGGTNYVTIPSANYTPAGQITGLTYGNGVVASFGYSADRLQMTALSYVKSSTTLLNLAYGYTQPNGGNNGQITGITDNTGTPEAGRSVTYTYDALYRLKTAVTTGSTQYPQWGLSWTYDRYGNRTAQSVTAGSGPPNSVTIDPATNRISGYCYDLNGNLLAEAAPPCPAPTYKYNAENRLVDFQGGGALYSYDGAGLRVKKVSGGTTTVYVFSGSKVIAEYVNGAAPASPTREYIYSGSALVATHEGATLKYHQADHLSVRVTTDINGTALNKRGHYPYGESWYEELYGSGTAEKLKFTTYERDAESGNDYALARYHINRLGRFNSPDPLAGSISDPQSLNRFAYVSNDPANRVDPLGLDDFPACNGQECIIQDESYGGGTCRMDGMSVPCNYAMGFVRSGAAGIVPPGVSISGPGRMDYFGNGQWADPIWFSGDGRFTPDALLERSGLSSIPFLYDPLSQEASFQGQDVSNGFRRTLQTLEQARSATYLALLKDPNCLTFLGGGALPMLSRGNIVPTGYSGAGPIAATATMYSAFPGPNSYQININESGPFFTSGGSYGPRIGGRPMASGSPRFQAFVLFHEVGHVTGAIIPDGSIGNPDKAAQAANNAAIASKCKNALLGLSNTAPR